MAEHKIVVTDTLKVEKMDMAVIDLSYRYLYRIVEPVPMMWQVGKPISTVMNLYSNPNLPNAQEIICKELLNEWFRIIEETSHLQQWDESLNWMKEIKNVIVIDCQPQATGQTFDLKRITYGN